MSITITQTLVDITGANVPDGTVVRATPQNAALFEQFSGTWKATQYGSLTAATSAGSFSLTLPDASVLDPQATLWQVSYPNGAAAGGNVVWQGYVTAGMTGTYTLKALKDTYGWSLVSAGGLVSAPAAAVGPGILASPPNSQPYYISLQADVNGGAVVFGNNTETVGSNSVGVAGQTSAPSSTAISGTASASSSWGGYFRNTSSNASTGSLVGDSTGLGGPGTVGVSGSGVGVSGTSTSGNGVNGATTSYSAYAGYFRNSANDGRAYSLFGDASSLAGNGVLGQSGSGNGVLGQSGSGNGLYGSSVSGQGGYVQHGQTATSAVGAAALAIYRNAPGTGGSFTAPVQILNDYGSGQKLTSWRIAGVEKAYIDQTGAGQFPTVYGSSAASGNLTLDSTSNATKGFIYLGGSSAYDGTNIRLGIGTTTPSTALHVTAAGGITAAPPSGTALTATGVGSATAVSGSSSSGYGGYFTSTTGTGLYTSSIYSAGDVQASNLFSNGSQTYVGDGAGTGNTASYVVALGSGSLKNNTQQYSTAVGVQALSGGNTGDHNTAVGNQALLKNTSGYQNVALGELSMSANTTGAGNAAIGFGALSNLIDGSGNMAVGGNALSSLLHGTNNVAVGAAALQSEQYGSSATAVGQYALQAQSSQGSTITSFGSSTQGAAYTTVTPASMTGIANGITVNIANSSVSAYNGNWTVSNVQASTFDINATYSSTATGAYWHNPAQGQGNVAIGNRAGWLSVSTFSTRLGSHNTFIGTRAALSSSTVDPNCAIAIGYQAMVGGDYAIAIGSSYNSDGNNGATAAYAGSVAIGTDSYGNAASSGAINEIRLGTSSHTTLLPGKLQVNGNIGFYGTAPGAKPSISGSRGGNAALASLLTSLASLGLITDSTTA